MLYLTMYEPDAVGPALRPGPCFPARRLFVQRPGARLSERDRRAAPLFFRFFCETRPWARDEIQADVPLSDRPPPLTRSLGT